VEKCILLFLQKEIGSISMVPEHSMPISFHGEMRTVVPEK
jgi:hypothetical protein